MQIKVFTIPFCCGERQNDEMNVFLKTHKVVDVQQAVSQEHGWTFCIKYIDSAGIDGKAAEHRSKPDYKELLDEQQFTLFSALRKARKEIASTDAIPAYAVFTDAELAEFSKLQSLDESSMKKIPGVGAQRVAGYGKRLLEVYARDNVQGQAAEEERQDLGLM